jgi:hypothetical protein
VVEQSAFEGRSAVLVSVRWAGSAVCVGHVQQGPITISPPFSEKKHMSNPQDDNQPVVWAVLLAVILLAVGLAVGFGIAKSKKAAPAASVSAPAAVTSPAAEASAPAADASVPAASATPAAEASVAK